MSKYASSTSVSAQQSRNDIEKVLSRYGAAGFMYGWEDNSAVVGFRVNDRNIRFIIAMPNKDDYRLTPSTRQRRSPTAVEAAWEQASRQRWRALLLVVKAKLEAVEAGISTFEEEFLAHIILPDGTTVGQWMLPQVEAAYESGDMPSSMLQLGTGR